jgi:hypothetical protein
MPAARQAAAIFDFDRSVIFVLPCVIHDGSFFGRRSPLIARSLPGAFLQRSIATTGAAVNIFYRQSVITDRIRVTKEMPFPVETYRLQS